MELNTFNTKEGLIDLHIHSDYSYCDSEYMQTGVKPLNLLEELKNFSNTFNSEVVFSLTDHDNTLGAKEIKNEIDLNSDKYPKVKFISGIELSVSCKSLGTYKVEKENNFFAKNEEENIFEDIHLLGYNYDVENPTLNYYSQINSLAYENTFKYKNKRYPYGKIIFAGKNYLEKLGKKIPFEDFLDFKIESGNRDRKSLFQNINNFCIYCAKDLGIDAEIVKKMNVFLLGGKDTDILNNKLNVKYLNECNLIENSKLDVLEAMSMIEKAGGITVLAHPKTIEFNSEYLSHINVYEDKYGFLPKRVNGTLTSVNFCNYINNQIQAKENMLRFILSKLIYKARNPMTGEKLKGLMGIELLHKRNMHVNYFNMLANLCQSYNLYTTGGSDKHGCLNEQILSLGQVMPLSIERQFTKSDKKKIMFSIYNCAFVDDILRNNNIERKKNNHQIELLARLDNKYAILYYHNIKKLITSYANIDYSDFANRLKLNKSPNKKKKYKPKINFENIKE